MLIIIIVNVFVILRQLEENRLECDDDDENGDVSDDEEADSCLEDDCVDDGDNEE